MTSDYFMVGFKLLKQQKQNYFFDIARPGKSEKHTQSFTVKHSKGLGNIVKSQLVENASSICQWIIETA